jgi:hypothetical protein
MTTLTRASYITRLVLIMAAAAGLTTSTSTTDAFPSSVTTTS